MTENGMNTNDRAPWIIGMLVTGLAGLGLGVAVTGSGNNDIPAECLDAVDEGERLAQGLEITLDWTEEILTAAANLDTARMDELNTELTATADSGEFDGALPDFRAAAQACENA